MAGPGRRMRTSRYNRPASLGAECRLLARARVFVGKGKNSSVFRVYTQHSHFWPPNVWVFPTPSNSATQLALLRLVSSDPVCPEWPGPRRSRARPHSTAPFRLQSQVQVVTCASDQLAVNGRLLWPLLRFDKFAGTAQRTQENSLLTRLLVYFKG